MRQTALRKNDGQALRDAMAGYGGTGIGLKALSQKTRAGTGPGVSYQLIGFLTLPAVNSSRHRKTCSVESAHAIEDALGVARGTLFDIVEAPSRSDKQPGWDELGNVGAR